MVGRPAWTRPSSGAQLTAGAGAGAGFESFEQTIATGLAVSGDQTPLGHKFLQVIPRGLWCSEAEDVLDLAHRRGIAGSQSVADETEDPFPGLPRP